MTLCTAGLFLWTLEPTSHLCDSMTEAQSSSFSHPLSVYTFV